jgi:hypothetical protein
VKAELKVSSNAEWLQNVPPLGAENERLRELDPDNPVISLAVAASPLDRLNWFLIVWPDAELILGATPPLPPRPNVSNTKDELAEIVSVIVEVPDVPSLTSFCCVPVLPNSIPPE